MLEEAKQLIELGLPIIPICSHDHKYTSVLHNEKCKCKGKTPLIKDWQTHNNTTLAELQSWTRQFKTFNIGLPLGEASGYCGIDVDGEQGVTFLMDMSKGDLPSTWEFQTGNGQRLIYTIPAGIKTKKFKLNAQGHEECALLCTGQQTVLPPSVHYTGAAYQWVDDHSPWDLDCAPAPKWLMQLIKQEETPINLTNNIPSPTNYEDEFTSLDFLNELPQNVQIPQGKTVKSQKGKTNHSIVISDEMLKTPIPEGARDNTMTSIVGHYCANRDLRNLGKAFIEDICLKHNKEYCLPPLDDQAVIDKVNYFFEAESLKDADYAAKKKNFFSASQAAKDVLKYLNNGGIILHFDQFSKIYYYTTAERGPWYSTRNYTLINKWIRDVITSAHFGDDSWDKRSFIDETRTALEEQFTAAYKTVDDFDLGAHSKELSDYIVVNNGMVDWKNNTLLAWDYKVKTTLSFDLEYNPYATCPHFEQYMAEWLPDPKVRAVIQEYLGYCLIPNTNYRKALFLYGKGKNGKSMLIEFLQKFFGDHSASLSYDGLFTRFGPAQLKDKLVNIFDDTTVSFTKETSIAKNLIAGGTISAEFKSQQLFQFANVARFIYSSQETPRTTDSSVAWYDRWFFVKFSSQFRPSNVAKTEIEKNLELEKQGIFNWMIEGLKRLMEQDSFSDSDALTAYTQEYKGQNDNVCQFVQSMCINTEKTKNNNLISITDLYKIYGSWIEHESLHAVSKKVFIQRVSDFGYTKSKEYIKGKSGILTFTDLKLNTLSEDYGELSLELAIILNL